jgi:hypothetical protein
MSRTLTDLEHPMRIADRRLRPHLPWRRGALLLAVALVLIGVSAGDARASVRQAAPWCAYLGSGADMFDCSYFSFEQCMATAWGVSNYCARNPYAVAVPERPPPRRKRQQPR